MKENIEEVVERLEKSINDVWFSTTYSQEDEERDLQALLSDYKRVLKENEELKNRWDKDTHKLQNDLDIANAKILELEAENEELKQSLIINKKLYEELCNKNNELKRDNELARQALKEQCDIVDERNQLLKENKDWQKAYQEEKDKQFELLRKNQKLQKENEELKKFMTEGITIEPNSPYKNYRLDFLRENFIPIQKIQDKIEELKEKYKTELEKNSTRAFILKCQITILEDLLEEKEE